MLLATTATSVHTGFEWNEDRKTVKPWGTFPTVIEPVRGEIALRGLKHADAIKCQPLPDTPGGLDQSRLVREAVLDSNGLRSEHIIGCIDPRTRRKRFQRLRPANARENKYHRCEKAGRAKCHLEPSPGRGFRFSKTLPI
jgi:hypothetical protein